MKTSNDYNRLKEMMSKKGIRQIDLVKMTGIHKSTLSLYINGKRIPNQVNLKKLSDALNVNPLWLTGFDLESETEFMQKYNRLNSIGRKKVDEYLDDLLLLYEDKD